MPSFGIHQNEMQVEEIPAVRTQLRNAQIDVEFLVEFLLELFQTFINNRVCHFVMPQLICDIVFDRFTFCRADAVHILVAVKRFWPAASNQILKTALEAAKNLGW